TRAEVRSAVAIANGLPGVLTNALTWTARGRGVSWVHETAPEYGVGPRVPRETAAPPADRAAGVARLERAADAARALARRGRHARATRVLERCAGALA